MHIFNLNLWKTIYLNFRYLPFCKAFKLPIFIYNNTLLKVPRGEVNIKCKKVHMGMIRIGMRYLGNMDVKHQRSVWEVRGEIVFNGSAIFGAGTKITVGRNAALEIGNNFCVSGLSTIICNKNIHIGNECLFSWDVLIMDTDFHKILDTSDNIINEDRAIIIGNHVWVGCRNTILKGVFIPDNNVIAAGSIITKTITNSKCIVGKNSEILKEKINWKR